MFTGIIIKSFKFCRHAHSHIYVNGWGNDHPLSHIVLQLVPSSKCVRAARTATVKDWGSIFLASYRGNAN
jgi:hypothetical protein